MTSPDEARRKRKDYNLRRRYGIGIEVFEALLAAQGGVCAVCKEGGKVFCVDHNHKTLKIRGILCLACNLRVVGGARDADWKLINAAEYVTYNPADLVFPDGIFLEKNPPKRRRKRRVSTARKRK